MSSYSSFRASSPLTPSPSYPAEQHECVKRNDCSGVWMTFRAWWPIPAHLLCYSAFASMILIFVDGHSFPTRSSSFRILSQSDVVTIISACLVCVRLLAGIWQVLATWRCAFIALEKSGITLSQLSSLVSLQWPVLSRHPYMLLSSVVILLAWPAHLVAPLASGSISWIPTQHVLNSNSSLACVPVAQTRKSTSSGNGLNDSVAGFAATSVLKESNLVAPRASRVVTSLRPFGNSSVTESLTVPYIKLSPLKWVADPTALSDEVKQAIINDKSGFLNFSSINGQLTQVVEGNAALLETKQWIPYDSGVGLFPNASNIMDKTMYVAVFIARFQNDGKSYETCHANTTSNFGQMPNMRYIAIDYDNNHTNCYAVASTKIDAGVKTCEGIIVSPMVVQCKEESAQSQPATDPLVDIVFAMLPDVVEKVAALNISHTNGRNAINTYTHNLVVQSYQATWSRLTEYLAVGEEVETTVYEPKEAVFARVSTQRIYLWIGLNALLTVSGIVLGIVQARCKHKVILDPALSAIMLDTRSILAQDNTGLCNAAITSRKDSKLGKLRLRQPAGKAARYHDMLIIEDSQTAMKETHRLL